MTLDQLNVKQKGMILSVDDSQLKTRLTDLGFVPETIVECQLKSPFGDPTAYKVKGTLIALRKEDAKTIKVGAYDK